MESTFVITPEEKENTLDLRKILQKLFFYKYFFLFSFIASITCAWIVNRYTTPVFVVKSSLLIKQDRNKTSAAQLLYNSEFMEPSRRMLGNDIVTLRSTPFLRRAIREMDLGVSYYLRGSIKTTEIYNAAPFLVKRLDDEDSTRSYPSFRLVIRSPQEYELLPDRDDKNVQGKVYQFNRVVQEGKAKFMISLVGGEPSIFNKTLYSFKFNDVANLAQYYRHAINAIQMNKDASVITLSITTTVPDKDINVLNKVMEMYIRHNLQDKTLEATRTINFINEQLGEVGDTLNFVEDKLQAFKQRHKFTESADPVEKNFSKLFQLETDKGALSLNEKYYSYLENYLKDPILPEKIVTPSALGVKDELLGQLVSQLVELQIEKNTFLKGGQSKSPLLADIEVKLQNVKRSVVENISNARANNQIALQDINAQIRSMEAQIKAVPGAERELVNIKRIYTLNENIYLLLLQKRIEAEISRASATEDSRIIEPAYLEGLVSPKTRNNYVLAIVAALLIPLALILLKEYVVNTVRSRDELEGLSRIPIFGMVNRNDKKSDDIFNTIHSSKSMLAESFRSVRSNLGFFIDPRKTNTFLVTSSISGEGKTFCSTSLAVVLAATQKKTILITTDLRKPKVYLKNGVDMDAPGLSNYLIDGATIDQVIQKSTIPHMDFISSGPVPPNPTELLMRENMDVLMQELKQRYDYVVVDTAPLGLVSDPLLLTKYSDLNIYIVRQNYTPSERVSALNKMYKEGKIRNIGFILNDVKKYSEGYYGYGNYGYGYYDEEGRKGIFKKIKQVFSKK